MNYTVDLPVITGNYDITIRMGNTRREIIVSGVELKNPYDEWEVSRVAAGSLLLADHAGEPFNVIGVQLSNDYLHHRMNGSTHIKATEMLKCLDTP